MANNFDNGVVAAVGTTPTTVYTAPADVTATVIGLSLANIITGNITADVTVTDTSAAVTVFLVKDAPIPVGGALIVIGDEQKVVLKETDLIQVTSSDASSIDVVISVLEKME